MIISRGRQYIFVHIPKTGGTALTLALEARAKADDLIIGDTPKARKRRHRLDGLQSSGRLWKHARLSDIDGVVTPAEIEQFFIFTFVRNPWDRVVSYYHWLRDQGFDHPAVQIAKVHDFSGFLNHPHTQSSLQAAPYGSYVTDLRGTERCNAFVRLERLQDDLAPVEAHLGFGLYPLARANPSDRDADYRGYYSDADADLVSRICAVDIARFGYAFDGAP